VDCDSFSFSFSLSLSLFVCVPFLSRFLFIQINNTQHNHQPSIFIPHSCPNLNLSIIHHAHNYVISIISHHSSMIPPFTIHFRPSSLLLLSPHPLQFSLDSCVHYFISSPLLLSTLSLLSSTFLYSHLVSTLSLFIILIHFISSLYSPPPHQSQPSFAFNSDSLPLSDTHTSIRALLVDLSRSPPSHH